MDLYGLNAGVSSANSSRQRVAQGNQAVIEFNKSLDAQVDTLKLEGTANAEQLLSDRNTKIGTVSANAAAKFGLKAAAKTGAKTGFKTAAAGRNAAAAARITGLDLSRRARLVLKSVKTLELRWRRRRENLPRVSALWAVSQRLGLNHINSPRVKLNLRMKTVGSRRVKSLLLPVVDCRY